jgi:hypothetical protein
VTILKRKILSAMQQFTSKMDYYNPSVHHHYIRRHAHATDCTLLVLNRSLLGISFFWPVSGDCSFAPMPLYE